MQDMALDILENDFPPQMKYYSDLLVNLYFRFTDGIDTLKLELIRQELGMNTDFEDISIINKQGVIVNSTIDNEIGLVKFAYDEENAKMLESVYNNPAFINERFIIDTQSGRLKKYSYQPTLDGKYIVELSKYSPRADNIIHTINKRLNDLSRQHKNIVSVDLFIGAEHPFSLNKDAFIPGNQLPVYNKVLTSKSEYRFNENTDNAKYRYHFIYLNRRNPNPFRETVIRITSDRSCETLFQTKELYKFFVIFGLATFIVIILLYRKAHIITDPIRNLLEKVNRITGGNLKESADINGNNEITLLSEQFNKMIDQLAVYYDELEENVRQRTAEIMMQKEELETNRDAIQDQRNILSAVNNSLQEAYLEIEEQKKHIEDSIHYARRIQMAILPPEDNVKELIPDSFILNMPKDIVSGDFYWLTKANDKIMVAAVDCTGHGVPGAFMSIVGFNQLNYIINTKGITRPSEVLNAMNQGVTKTLRQTRVSSAVRDGMDICLISIDKENQIIEYAGAYNPLYIFHNNNKFSKIEADKSPVGGYIGEKLISFKNHEYAYSKGDMIYLFSDGYADQFGGVEDTKFMLKRFKDLLQKIHNEPVEEQKLILYKTHKEWKGDGYQVDDILIIGIRL